MTLIPAGDWITALEAATLLGVSKRRVQVLIKDGRIPARLFGKGYILLRSDVVAFKAVPRKPGRPPDPPAPGPKKRRGT